MFCTGTIEFEASAGTGIWRLKLGKKLPLGVEIGKSRVGKWNLKKNWA